MFDFDIETEAIQESYDAASSSFADFFQGKFN